MRLARLAIAGSFFSVMLTAAAFAQDSPPNYLRQPAEVQRTAFEYDNYLYFAPGEGGATTGAPATAPKAEATPAAPVQGEVCNNCDNGECSDASVWGMTLPCRNNDGQPWTIRQPDFLAERRITVGGWLEAGAYGNQYNADLNGPIGLRPNKFLNVDQLYGYAERVAKQGECEWDWGGRVDYVFGVDAPFTQTTGDHGFDYNWNSSSFGGRPLYGSAVPQAYGDATYGGFKMRVGHFYTPIGYEVVAATGNFFYSHSYAHTFGEPFTHTGALASQNVGEKLTVYGGWVTGWDGGFTNKNDSSMFLGGLSYKLNDCTNVAWYMTWGYNGDGNAFIAQPAAGGPAVPAAAQGNMFMNSFVLSHQITSAWSYVFQGDYADNSNLQTGSNLWYGINQYLFYEVNRCWKFGGRFEWFRDDDGVRVVPGNAGNYYQLATGVNWKPRANILVRPELRYDWYEGGVANATSNPFHNGQSSTQMSGGCDVIFTF